MTAAHMQTPEYKKRVAEGMQIEAARQALLRGEATPATLAYARFLVAVENDATLGHGHFERFRATDEEVVRAYPFLSDLAKEAQPWPAP